MRDPYQLSATERHPAKQAFLTCDGFTWTQLCTPEWVTYFYV